MANRPVKPIFPQGLESEEQISANGGVLNGGVLEHVLGAVMTLPVTEDADGLPSAVRYNENEDQYEAYYANGGWNALGGGAGGRWEVLPVGPTHVLSAGRGYLVDNSSAASLVYFPTPTKIGQSITLCDLQGKFSTHPLTVDGDGFPVYGSLEPMVIATDNCAATFTWSGPDRGWIVTAGIGLGQGRVYSRSVYTQTLTADSSQITLDVQVAIADVYVDGKRLSEAKYTLDGFNIDFSPSLLSGSEVQVIEYVPVQLAKFDASKTVTWVYNNGAAIGGETQITLDPAVTKVSEIYVEGVRKQLGIGFTFDSTTHVLAFIGFTLNTGDELVVVINGDPTVYNQIDRTPLELARSFNLTNNQVILSSDHTTTLDNRLVIYDVVAQKSWGIPTVGIPAGATVYSVSGSNLTYTSSGVQSTIGLVAIPGSAQALANLLATDQGAKTVGYKPSLSGAVLRTLYDKHIETISVKDFGAKGDGVTDDTAAIQAAVNSIINTQAALYFPPGYYVVSSVINVDLSQKTHIRLFGAGTSSTVIKCTGDQAFVSATSSVSNNIWLDSVTPNGSLDISDLSIGCWGGTDLKGTAIYINTNTIVGTPAHSIHFTRVDFRCESGIFNHMIYIKNSAQIKIDSCNFYSGNGSQKGIAIVYGNDAGKDGAGLQVSNCEFFFFQYGVYITDHYEGGQFINCNFINCYGGIFAVIDGAESGIFINGCEFDCYFKGVYLQNMFDFVIADSCFFSVDSDSYYGIHIRGGSGFTVTGNKIHGEASSVVGGIGILLENTDDALGRAAYVGSNAISSMNIGMQISNCSNITFGPWAWRNCNVDTVTSGTNTYIQQSNYELVSSIAKTLSSATTAWTFTVDISQMRLKRVPEYASLVSQSVDNFVCRYVKSSSSNTSLTFEVNYGDHSSIAANTYGFSLLVKSSYFINVN